MNLSLFKGEKIYFDAFNPDKDAEIEAQWTHDTEYLRLLDIDPARPLSTHQVKKKYEEMEKEAIADKPHFYFALRTAADDRLVGFATVRWIEWSHGCGWLQLGIGRPEDRGQGYGTEALNLALRYAFHELNLYRLSVYTSEYNPAAVHFLQAAGFTIEVRRRQLLQCDGRRFDALVMGILREEWERREA